MAIEVRGMAPLLQVFDMPLSIAFYRDVLGFEVVSTSKPRGEHFDWALLRLNGVELMLLLIPLALLPTTILASTSRARMWMRRTLTSVHTALLQRSPRSRPTA